MNKRAEYGRRLRPLLRDPLRAGELVRLLLEESGLPGPRGNLELAAAFADAVTEASEPAGWLDTLYSWAAIDAREAPTGDAREYLPFCAVVAFGALYHRHACGYPCPEPCTCPFWPAQRLYLLEAVRTAAEDPRWRVREAAAMALQRLGEEEPAALPPILDRWLTGPSLLARRAVAAALAHPPLLRDESLARYALGAAERVLRDLTAVPSGQRKSEEFRVLFKGLSYAVSVIAAALPGEGFPFLERWAFNRDPDIRKVLVANLKKRRLTLADPERTAALSAKLMAG
jgi:HEAT repeat protein